MLRSKRQETRDQRPEISIVIYRWVKSMIFIFHCSYSHFVNCWLTHITIDNCWSPATHYLHKRWSTSPFAVSVIVVIGRLKHGVVKYVSIDGTSNILTYCERLWRLQPICHIGCHHEKDRSIDQSQTHDSYGQRAVKNTKFGKRSFWFVAGSAKRLWHE